MAESQADVASRAKNLRKRLSQIVALEEKVATCPDFCLTEEQNTKLERKAELEAELQLLFPTAMEPTVVQAVVPADKPRGDAEVAPATPKHTFRHPTEEDVMVGSPRARAESCRWEDDPVAVEDVAPPKFESVKEIELEILENIQPFATASQACTHMRRLVRATSDLSVACFETDVIKGVSRKGRWKLTLLARKDSPHNQDDPWGGLLGFIAYKVKPLVQSISIAKLAVVPESRGRGHGHKLTNWCIAMGKKLPNIVYLSLTSLPKAIRFYKQIGFKQVDVDLAKLDPMGEDDDADWDVVQGQIYMEYRCKGRGGQRKSK